MELMRSALNGKRSITNFPPKFCDTIVVESGKSREDNYSCFKEFLDKKGFSIKEDESSKFFLSTEFARTDFYPFKDFSLFIFFSGELIKIKAKLKPVFGFNNIPISHKMLLNWKYTGMNDSFFNTIIPILKEYSPAIFYS